MADPMAGFQFLGALLHFLLQLLQLELGELLLLLGEDEAACAEFKTALPLLRDVAWLRESDPARLERIEALALEE